MKDILLISGIPASGKNFFSAWLERTKGYIHFDYENEIERLEREGLLALWSACCSGAAAKPFVDALRRRGSSIVWNWGFPPEAIEIVRSLKREGVHAWWFNADHAAARKAYIARGDPPVKYFDIQMPKIVRAWPSIKALFEPNMIETLQADGSRMSPEVIYQRMQGDESDGSNNPLHLTAGFACVVEMTSGCSPAAGERER